MNAWRARQFDYQWLCALSGQYVDFLQGWDVAGAKWFGYPTFWINRQASPMEELGVEADASGQNLNSLVQFVLSSGTGYLEHLRQSRLVRE